MPLYEYECAKCKKVQEVVQKFSDAPLEECLDESCKGPMTKLMSMNSFALKGSGWYTSDYKRKGGSDSAS
jgi:putative FmdB family regulatory protein